MEDGPIELPRRHVREIAMQVTQAIECKYNLEVLYCCLLMSSPGLHAEGVSHTDICPENIEVVDDTIISELYVDNVNSFSSRVCIFINSL